MKPQLEVPNESYDWKTTNNHEGELVMAYNNNTGNNTLYPRTFYALYIGLNNNGIVHLIFKLSTKQILNTMKYQTVSVPENLIKIINETDSFFTKIQFGHFYSDCFTDQDDHSDNNKDDGQTL